MLCWPDILSSGRQKSGRQLQRPPGNIGRQPVPSHGERSDPGGGAALTASQLKVHLFVTLPVTIERRKSGTRGQHIETCFLYAQVPQGRNRRSLGTLNMAGKAAPSR